MTTVAVPRRRRPAWWAFVGLIVVAAVVAVSLVPVTTRQGLDFDVLTRSLPLYIKVFDFIDRDLNYRALARRITAGRGSDEARALSVLEWTRAHIRDQPPTLPVVDDHVWHIIVRGYGLDEQKVDVFTTLATYAGVSAYWIRLTAGEDRLPIALVRIDNRWRVLDVAHGVVFRGADSGLLSADELAADHGKLPRHGAPTSYRGHPYAEYFRDFRPPAPPDVLRADLQMPGRRILFEAKRLVGLGGRYWDPAPTSSTPSRQEGE